MCLGEPDTEERHLRQLSPASSIDTQSSLATRSSARLRNKHHHSPGSDTAETPGTPKRKRGRASAAPSLDSPTSEGRPRRKSFTAAQQAIATPTRRSRRLTSQVNIQLYYSIVCLLIDFITGYRYQ